MSPEIVVLSALAVITLWLAWRLTRLGGQLERMAEAPPASLQLLQREVQAVRSGVDERLREHIQHTHELSQRIGRLQKATENVEQLGVGISELQKILQPPQLRGAFGERLLEELLADTLPRERYEFQYSYPSSGVRVDAAVFLGEGRLLPIDSKFPLDNFRPGASNEARCTWATVSRWSRPSESVFHEIAVAGLEVNGATLTQYAQRKRVVPVSPNTLHAYLSVVRMGLRGFQLQESAREMLASLTHLQTDIEKLRSELGTAVRQARHSLGNLEEAESALSRVEQRLEVLSGG